MGQEYFFPFITLNTSKASIEDFKISIKMLIDHKKEEHARLKTLRKLQGNLKSAKFQNNIKSTLNLLQDFTLQN